MHLAQTRGWRVEGIELNPRTAAYAAGRTGAPVHRVNAQTLALDGWRYAAVVLTDVLEHIPDPTRLLASLATLVEPGGLVAVKVPNGSAQWQKERWLARLTSHRASLADNLVHVNHFTPQSLGRALERGGFSNIKVETAAPELPPVVGARSALGHVVRRAVFIAASVPAAVRTPLALHLQAFATKDAR
jgi:SAM-dependent methyltransferase